MTIEQKKKFRVYFEQINQTYYDVSADSMIEAVAKAGRDWRRDHGPRVLEVECESRRVRSTKPRCA